MFSERTRWDRRANRLAALLEEKKRRGVPVLDLTESNPTAVGLAGDPTILAALSHSASLHYDPAPRGLATTRRAVAADYARRGALVEPEQVVLTASTSEAYAFLFKLLCDPGDNVLIPQPSYPLFAYLAGLEGVACRPYPLDFDGEWHLDSSALFGRLDPRTRAVVIVNPNNPTGSFLKKSEADDLLPLCAARNVALISDEVFADFARGDDPRRLVTLAGDTRALAFSLGGLSKSCGLPQMKLGWIVVSGPRTLCDEALGRLDVIADTFLSVGTPVQRAAVEWLKRVGELQAPITARITRNATALESAVAAQPEVSLLRPEGGWSAVLRFPATATEEARTLRLLEERNVLVHPGYFFDFSQEAFLVVSLLPRPEDFDRSVEQLLSTPTRAPAR